MASNEWFYYALARDVLNKDVFLCVFPHHVGARNGDRVVAESEDKTIQRIGDIFFMDFTRSDDGFLNAVVSNLLGGKKLKAVSYWNRREIEWPKDEVAEDGTSDQHTETVSL